MPSTVAGAASPARPDAPRRPDPRRLRGQARRAFENLTAVLAAACAELADVVKVTVLLVDGDDLPAYRTVREAYLGHRPASTLMVVKAPALPALRVEIEAIAVPG
jgi:2-iminobutanoate/2-iminopropanoate deaminase